MKNILSLLNRRMYRNKELNMLYDYYIVRGVKIEVKDRLKFDNYCRVQQIKEIIQNVFIIVLIFALFGMFYYIGGR